MQDLKISVAEILGRPGAYRDIHLTHTLEGISTALARLADAPAEADLRLESVMEGILVTGEVAADAVVNCARCLTELRTEVDLDVCELFYAAGHVPQDDPDSYRVKGDQIDLEPMVRDGVTLALPLNPLCSAECKGICPRCGKDLNTASCDCEETLTDPRWAALDALRDRLTS